MNEYEKQIRLDQLEIVTEKIVTILKAFDDDARLQKKYETLTAIMNGESANHGASVWVTLMADFCIACSNFGFDPKKVMVQISHDARKLIDQKLKEQGLTTKAPTGGQPN